MSSERSISPVCDGLEVMGWWIGIGSIKWDMPDNEDRNMEEVADVDV